MIELSLKEYCEKTGVELTNEEISILETYIELKIKDLECRILKPYLTNVRGDKLYPNQLDPFKVTCNNMNNSGVFDEKTSDEGRLLFSSKISEPNGLFK